MDVWGPSPTPSISGCKYYLLQVDDFSRFSWLYLLQRKSEVLQMFVHFKNHMKNMFSTNIKIIHTGGGGEFNYSLFKSFLAQHEIIQQVTCLHTLSQNGVAERKHRHIIETTRSLLHTTSMPQQLWGEATLTAIYLINRLPTPVLGQKSPFQKLFDKEPDYHSLRVLGSACYP